MRKQHDGELLREYKRGAWTVEIRAIPDESPDLRYLGEYSDTPGPEAIDREKRGEMMRHTFRYFNPSRNYEGEPARRKRYYQFQDYRRMEAYNRGEWAALGIVARVLLDEPGKAYPRELGEASCWGYESDAGAYLLEAGRELASEAITAARDNVKRAAALLKEAR